MNSARPAWLPPQETDVQLAAQRAYLVYELDESPADSPGGILGSLPLEVTLAAFPSLARN